MIARSMPRTSTVTPTGRFGVLLWSLTSVTAVGVGVVAAVTAWRVPGLTAMSDSPIATVLMLGAGALLVVVGLEHVRRHRRRTAGALLAGTGIFWLLGEWANPAIGSSAAFTIGLLLGTLAPALLTQALLSFERGRLRSADIAIVVAGYLAFGVGLGLMPALTFDAAAMGCAFCPSDLIALTPSRSVPDAAIGAATALGATMSVVVCLRLLSILAVQGSAGRRLSAPVIFPGALFALVTAIELGWPTTGDSALSGRDHHLMRLIEAALLIAVAIGASREWIRARRSRTLVARLVAELGSSPPVGGLREALASTMHDSDLALAYPLPGDALVDGMGRPVSLDGEIASGRTITPIVRAGEVVALLNHRIDLLQSSEMVEEVIRAARLGIEHERLQALARAHLASLTAARKRIVAAASAERQRLERDLHDGAQQRLIAIALDLRLLAADAAGAGDPEKALIAGASEQIGLAIDELREVAHGLYPSVLADEGLAAAIESLGEGATTPVRLGSMEVDPLEVPVAEAVYALVAEVVGLGEGPVTAHATRDDGALAVVVEGPNVPDEVILELADRIGAVDGVLTASRPTPGRTTLAAEIPCAS
jgi:signal transduction histidine kinase